MSRPGSVRRGAGSAGSPNGDRGATPGQLGAFPCPPASGRRTTRSGWSDPRHPALDPTVPTPAGSGGRGHAEPAALPGPRGQPLGGGPRDDDRTDALRSGNHGLPALCSRRPRIARPGGEDVPFVRFVGHRLTRAIAGACGRLVLACGAGHRLPSTGWNSHSLCYELQRSSGPNRVPSVTSDNSA